MFRSPVNILDNYLKAGMAGEPYAANGNSRYETEFRNESCHNRAKHEDYQDKLIYI
jgi:hypothetical protein